MFPPRRPSSPTQPSPSCSDDLSSTRDALPKLFHRHYVHDLSTFSHSLATTHSLHDDLPTPSMPTHVSHTTSTHSTPMTSPSTGYSSLFPGSLSSATSESAPSAESKHRSEFGLLIPTSAAHSPIHGSASSRSSRPVSPRSRSTTESGPQTSSPHVLYKRPSEHFSNRPGTAHTDSPLPTLATSSSADSNPADHHTRSHSRLTVSIKNLFSRHPGPSPSRFSFNSTSTMAPDSEASSSSFHVPTAAGKWSTPCESRPPDPEISGSVAPPMPSPGRGPDSPIDAHRRYASEASPKLYNARTGGGMPTSQECLDVSSRNIPPTRGREARPRNVLRRRPSGSAKLIKGRERGMSSPSPHQNEGDADLRLPPKEGMSRQVTVPFPLTPAGAVVEAYKQQELHRDDSSTPPKLSIDDRMSSTASHDAVYDHDHPEHSPTPYYTVFGSSSERRVKAGGPDDRWSVFGSHQRIFTASQVTPSHQPSMSDPGGRITRKFSSRWRQVKGEVLPEESPSCDRGHSKGRPSMQETWGADKSPSHPTGQSIDSVPNPRDGAWASPSASHTRSESKGDKGEGPILWRLMRRISTGGLRDRFQSDKAAPPVPALPKELSQKINTSERNNDPLSTPRHKPSFSLRDKDHSQTYTIPRNIVGRPSAQTSSSSPNSSDVASMQFFKTHSARSSISSYGEPMVISRVAENILDRHIITPREQLRLADDHVESGEPSMPCVPRSPRRTTSVPTGLRTVEDGDSDHLVLPSPQRQTRSVESPTSASSRPCSACPSATSGSARASYQSMGATIGPSRMADGIVSLSPPPRTAKTLTRGGSVASPPSQLKQTDGGTGIGIGGARQMDRMPSSRSDMTARLESPEPRGLQDQDAPLPTQRQYTFRELNAPRKPPLSEREKADIWDDLLAQSDKAGGTLHINGAAGLLSDSMRFSTYSETSRVLD